MSKRLFMVLAVGLLSIAPVQGVFLNIAAAAETGTWVDGDMPQLTVGVTASPNVSTCFQTTVKIRSHTTQNGFFDPIGHDVNINICGAPSYLGLTGSGYLEQGEYAYKMVTYDGRPMSLGVDPDSHEVTYQQPTPLFGPSTYMAWPGSVTFNSTTEIVGMDEALRMSGAPPMMKDSAGNLIIKMPPQAFSSNGEWMVFYAQGLGLVRANLVTHDLLLFDTMQISYDLGFYPEVEMAISDDGNSAVISGIGLNAMSTRAYDLSGCQQLPFVNSTNNTVLGCRSRYIQPDLVAANPGYVGMNKMSFTADGKAVRGVADFLKPNNTHEYHGVTLSMAGYQIHDVKYLALGDSFSSGEGEFNYALGTDIHGDHANLCHTSELSYSYLAAEAVGSNGPVFHNMACSGARVSNYFGNPQYDNTSDFTWTPGEEAQSRYVKEAHPDVVTISMIGNDIGFRDKIVQCLNPFTSCFKYKEERQSIADDIYAHFDALVSMYESIQQQSGGAKVYVLGYPQLLTDNPNPQCTPSEPFDNDEIAMARGLVSYLNAVIQAATQYAGVQYIDVENAFEGQELCDGRYVEKAVNGLVSGDDTGAFGVNVIGNESFHPNVLGHDLMAQALLAQSGNLTLPMPVLSGTVDTSVAIPYVGSLPYNQFIGNAPSNGSGYTSGTYVAPKEDDGKTLDLILQNSPTHITDTQLKMQPNATFNAVVFSTPTPAGTVQTDAQGHLNGTITVPSSVEPGFHMLHLTGNDIGGKPVDLYKAIYVAASATDWDGDGIPNSEEKCLGTQAVNEDVDRDGIDDACDPEVTEPPADTTPPQVVGTPDRDANSNGWYNNGVTINWTATDPDPSSGAPTQPAATFADQEGIRTYTSEQSCDPLNNCATGSLELKIDKTAPDITYTLSQAPNAQGWNNGSVLVTFNCSDAISGVAACSQPQLVSGSDGVYMVIGDVTDNAGNTNSVNALVSLDSTAPTISQTALPAPNADGWNNTDVTVLPICDDNLSGILECGPSFTFSTDGANQVATSMATDNAGNTASATTSVNIDKTAPTLGTPSWNNNPKSFLGPATVTVAAADNLSGIKQAEYFLDDNDPGAGNGTAMRLDDGQLVADFGTDLSTGVHKVTMRALDKAGNWSHPIVDYLVVYDPFGARMTGHRTLIPSLANGDVLPGLNSPDQTDKVKFGFNVRYDKTGAIKDASDVEFSYDTGTKCGKPDKAVNCHAFDLNAQTIDWLVTQGQNSSTGIIQGTATLNVDGTQSNVVFRLTGIDGEQLDVTSPDHLTLKVYAQGADPNTASPIYQVNADILRGNIKINTW